ncbi:LacI family transcriptional regulator [Devosia pacifica]|uniref:LacI family transcriptional regulator n=1 Tax=Devosia pacifica TaxID=1335967 RepID=A0A918S153_9HYPH|nr:substrate-binding domain-containing protein [Devosia pacifica]GHA18664.1 LacI family transcriptional regulator [Devosia pacifica]
MRGIKHLAEHLGLSIGTVSRALNAKPDVNPETRKRVLAAASALGYVPNQSGRSLRQGATNSVGFMIEAGDPSGNSDTFFMPVFDGVQQVLSRHHLDLVVLPCSAGEDPAQYLARTVARRQVDALILSATRRQDDRIALLSKARLPFIALGRSETAGNYPWIDLDFEGVATRSVARLVAAGHRRIAVALPSKDLNLGFVYLKGYRAALEKHDIAFDPSLVLRAASSEQGGYQIGHEILSMANPPTAIILHYELLAIGLYSRLHDAGLVPGNDLSIISFRESPISRFLSPRLTCFRLSLRELGVALGEALLASMPKYAEHYPQGVVQRVWPMEMVVGESDGPAAAASDYRS